MASTRGKMRDTYDEFLTHHLPVLWILTLKQRDGAGQSGSMKGLLGSSAGI
jgi:hypothetical protein